MLRECYLNMCLSGCGQGVLAKDVGGFFNCMDATSDICNFCAHGDLENHSDNQSPLSYPSLCLGLWPQKLSIHKIRYVLHYVQCHTQ